MSLSARNKYLTDEERQHYSIGSAEMFCRRVAHSRDEIKDVLNNMSIEFPKYKTRNGMAMPQKALVTYFNIHPASLVKAYESFSEQMNRHCANIISVGIKSGSPNKELFNPFRKMQTTLMSSIQKSRSRRLYVDIDVDIDSSESKTRSDIENELSTFFDGHGIDHHRILTHGGFHVLVKRESLSKKVPLHKLINDLDGSITNGEVKFNKNAMVPLPGTTQAGHLVQIT